jgi:hypothetical protein
MGDGRKDREGARAERGQGSRRPKTSLAEKDVDRVYRMIKIFAFSGKDGRKRKRTRPASGGDNSPPDVFCSGIRPEQNIMTILLILSGFQVFRLFFHLPSSISHLSFKAPQAGDFIRKSGLRFPDNLNGFSRASRAILCFPCQNPRSLSMSRVKRAGRPEGL